MTFSEINLQTAFYPSLSEPYTKTNVRCAVVHVIQKCKFPLGYSIQIFQFKQLTIEFLDLSDKISTFFAHRNRMSYIYSTEKQILSINQIETPSINHDA